LFLFVTGSADFVGINHYTTNLVAHKEQPIDVPHYERDQDIDISFSACWNTYVDIQSGLSYYVSFVGYANNLPLSWWSVLLVPEIRTKLAQITGKILSVDIH